MHDFEKGFYVAGIEETNRVVLGGGVFGVCRRHTSLAGGFEAVVSVEDNPERLTINFKTRGDRDLEVFGGNLLGNDFFFRRCSAGC